MTLQEMIEEQKRIQAEFKKNGEAAFKEFLKGYFEEFPGVRAVRWAQYTPGFNDGDPCYFTLGDVKVAFNEDLSPPPGEEEEEEDEDEEDEGDFVECSSVSYRNKGTVRAKAAKRIEEVIEGAKPILEEVFGDPVQVTATRQGIDVDEYDCGY